MNSFGHDFKVTLSGGSHEKEVGVLIEGVPEGIELSPEDFSADLSRRAPGGKWSTARHEDDVPVLLSGISGGLTTGETVRISFRNKDIRPQDYEHFADCPRPGHADRTAVLRYGKNVSLSGGGAFSGRMTVGIVAAGVIAKKMLGYRFEAHLSELGGIGAVGDNCWNEQWNEALKAAEADGDSLGGIVTLTVNGVPGGIGDMLFGGVESLLAQAFFSIPGVRGVSFGDGFRAAAMKGSEHNDPWGSDGRPLKNGSGGFAGGITTGAPIVAHIAFKPTSSIAKAQKTYNFASGKMEELRISGRHDVCFALRTPVIVEAMAAIVLADLNK